MRKVQAFVVLAVVLALFGCMKSRMDSQANSGPGGSDPNKPGSASVSGRVGLGASSNVEVWLYSGVPNQTSLPVAKTKTDKDGRFTLAFPGEYLDAPAYITAHFKSGSSKLHCFVPTGCANAEFSETYVIDDTWQLTIYVNKIKNGGHYNVVYLADIALAAAINENDGILSVADFTGLVNDYKSAVTNRFAAIGDLVQQPLVDVTNEAEVAVSDIRFIRNSAIELAIINHIRSISPEASVSQALAIFKRVFNTRGMANRGSNERELSFYGIISELIDIVGVYRSDVERIASLIAQLQANQLLFDVEALDQLEQGTSSPNANIVPIERAKNFVEDIRQIAGSLDLAKFAKFSDIASFVKGDINGLLGTLGMNMQVAEFLTDDNVDIMVDSVQLGVEAMILGLLNSYADTDLHEYTSDRGILVSITTVNEKTKKVSIDQEINLCQSDSLLCKVHFALVLETTIASLGGNPEIGLFLLNGANMQLTGMVANAMGAVNFLSPRQRFVFNSFKLEMQSDLSVNREWDNYKVYLKGLDMSLPLTYSAVNSFGAHTLSAVVTAKSEVLEVDLDNTVQYSAGADNLVTKSTDTRYAIKNIGTSDFFNLAAAVEGPGGGDLKASVTLRKDEYVYPGNSVYVRSEVAQCSLDRIECNITFENSAMEGEDKYHFLGLNTVAVYKARLKGIREPVQMEIGVVRETEVKNQLEHLRVSYPGHSFLLHGEFTNTGSVYKLDAESLDGVKMVIEQPGGFGTERQGFVKDYDGSVVADIEDMGKWIKITFGDGNFVSM